jgi:hypothetical protein
MSLINPKRFLKVQSNNVLQTIRKSSWVATYCFILLCSKVVQPQATPTPPSGTTHNYFNFKANPINKASSNQRFNQRINQQAKQENIQETSVEASQQSTQNTNVNVSHSVDIKHTVAIELPDIGFSDFKKYLSDQYDSSKKDCNSLLQSMSNAIMEHKWKLIGLTLIASYGVIAYKIYQVEQYLQQHNSWCNWKSAIPLPHLMLTPTTDLVSQLNFDMNCKYGLVITNMNDITTIPDISLHDLQAELGLLDRYASLLNIASRFHCQSLFCFNYSIDIIEEKRARLLFVYNLFIMIQTQQKR